MTYRSRTPSIPISRGAAGGSRDALDVLDDPVEPAAAALDCVAPDEEALEIDEVDDPELVDEARVDVDPEDDPTLAPVEPEETVDTVAVEDELPGVPVEAVALEEELLAVLEVWEPEEPAVVALAEAAVLIPMSSRCNPMR